jgi:hypothetical protein
MSSSLSIAVAAKKLASTFSGQLLQPADVGYDDAKKKHLLRPCHKLLLLTVPQTRLRRRAA